MCHHPVYNQLEFRGIFNFIYHLFGIKELASASYSTPRGMHPQIGQMNEAMMLHMVYFNDYMCLTGHVLPNTNGLNGILSA